MRIATFNLKNLFGLGYYSSHGANIEVSPDILNAIITNRQTIIHSLRPDILVAQEIGSKEIFKELGESNNLSSFIAPPDVRGISNGILYTEAKKVEALSDIQGLPVFHSNQTDNLGTSLKPYRNFVYLVSEYADKPLHIIGVHLKAASKIQLQTDTGEKVPITDQHEAGDSIIRMVFYKLAQARRLREIIDSIFVEEKDAQIIVLGDFNTECHSNILDIIKGTFEDPNTQLHDLCDLLPDEKRFSCIWENKKLMVDHIIISPSLQKNIERLEIFNERISDATDTENINSDHAPLLVTLK